MKNLYLVLVVLFVFPFSGFSQGENDNWVFGDQAAVNFSNGTPISISGSQMNAVEGVASVSDMSGNLLFYTNGIEIWNRNHQIMSNSCCMTAGNSSVQGVVIVPFPDHPNEYFVFTTNGNNNFSGFSKVDMTLNNGLGNVVTLNTPLLDHNGSTIWNNYIENITVTGASGGYWVLIAYNSNLLAYRVDSFGVDINPVKSPIEPLTSFESNIKVSPDRNFLTIGDYQGDIFYIYHFDASTGTVLGAPYIIDTFMYGVSFSSQSDIMWGSGVYRHKIYGYDMNTLNFSAPSVVFVADLDSHESISSMQMGPDGNIYFAINGSEYLGKISNPNNLNTATFNVQAVYLGGNSCYYGLPQSIATTFCMSDLTLTGNSEPLGSVTHEVNNRIITKNYKALPVNDGKITINAGNFIEMLPNTELLSIERGSILAIIEGCTVTSPLPYPSSYSDGQNSQTEMYSLNGESQIEMEIYPNPVSNILNINVSTEIEIESATMFDLLGQQTVMNISANNTLNTSNLAAGVYILKLETTQGTLTKKVIKQ